MLTSKRLCCQTNWRNVHAVSDAKDRARWDKDVANFTDYPGGHAEGFSDAHKMQYRAVYEHIASGRKTPLLFATAEDGHHEVKLCEAILKSSRSKGWVKVS